MAEGKNGGADGIRPDSGGPEERRSEEKSWIEYLTG